MKHDVRRPLVVADAATLHALPTRREFLRLVALGGTLVLSGGLLTACEDSTNVGGLTGPGTGATLTLDFAKGDVALLQFLQLLEQLEAAFYSGVVARFESSDLTSADRLVITDIAAHEAIHRDLLAAVLGSNALRPITPLFGGLSLTRRTEVLAAARGFEDRGVSAYNGVAPYFTDAANLALAMKIVSVEARHAAAIRDLVTPLSSAFAPTAFDSALSPSVVTTDIQPLLEDKLAFAGAPANFALSRDARVATSQTPADVVAALQTALGLAQLLSDLYQRGSGVTGLIPNADATVFSTLASHEAAHSTQLQSLISLRGATPRTKPAFDFTAKGNLPGFSFLVSQYANFTVLAQALEDLGVRLWKGQLKVLAEDKTALSSALSMHSVQARHASEIRRLRGKKGWITGNNRDDLPAFLQPIYDGEENTTHGSVTASLSGPGGTTAATESFDEALTTAQVTAILALFGP